MGCFVAQHTTVERNDRGGASLDDEEWFSRWIGKYHEAAMKTMDKLDQDHVDHIVKLLEVKDRNDP